MPSILLNLVSNAIKFTHEGEIVVAAKLLEKQSDQIKIKLSVQDTGIGIAKKYHDKIFDQFERLTAAYEGRYQGRGLGLYIVKQFAKLLNAEIQVNSVENQGTTIELILPLTVVCEFQKNPVGHTSGTT